MTTYSAYDRSHESIINDNLARLLREQCRLNAVAETLHNGKRPDIVVRLDNSRIVVLETEVEPAPTVESDALSRIGMEIDGRNVQNAFSVVVPKSLRSTSQQHLYERLSTANLAWQEWRSDGSNGPRTTGTVAELAQSAAVVELPAGDLDDTVDVLDKGARRAGAKLYQSAGTLSRVAAIFGTEPGDEAANMAALVIINAMLFQERLAAEEGVYQPVSAARHHGQFNKLSLLGIWENILEVDYYPIFSMARDVVDELSGIEASDVLNECAATATKLLGMTAVGRHDLAGMIFNRLISERKLLAAFYTSVPASMLLAGLALAPEKWGDMDWSDIRDLERLRVVDPACGTGTLLMAAYRQILQNNMATGTESSGVPILHRTLLEKTITGADVVQAAIHLTAATLAAMSPSVRFEQMNLHTLRLGLESQNEVKLGSLDWLDAPETQSFFSTSEEQVGATSGTGSVVQLPRSDLVITNPPYTRRGANGGQEDSIARVFSLPADDPESQNALKERTSELLKGTAANQIAGHGSSFTVLADRLVNLGGRIALVLPVTSLSGEAWREIRAMITSRYDIEFVVSSHDPRQRSMSFDTEIAEILLVARRLREEEKPTERGRFVNLWKTAQRETDAIALVKAINATAISPALRSDGPPVGGTPVMIGGEQWGEILDGPISEAPWTAARWKYALTGQFAAALERGEIWVEDGSFVAAKIPIGPLLEVANVGPQHRQIRGSLGVFDAYHGRNETTQFQAIWKQSAKTHKTMFAEPNAWLVPKTSRDYMPIWSQSGTMQVIPDVRYNSQRIMSAITDVRTLGVRAWHTVLVHEDNTVTRRRKEVALALWCNSTLGMLLHANHSNRAQDGRGTGSKAMLETLATLDVRTFVSWQLDAALTIWEDFREREFQPLYYCAIDPARIELDQRVIRDLLGLGVDAEKAVARLRGLLANEPSIHGNKEPQLPG